MGIVEITLNINRDDFQEALRRVWRREMFRRLWDGLLRLFGFLGRGAGRDNPKVKELHKKGSDGWVWDVTGVVVWVKPEDDAERSERRRRFFVHLWRLFKERFFGSKADHTNRYPHQIFNIEIEEANGLTVRIENNLYTGKALKNVAKGMRVEVAGEYLFNDRGGKIHHTHGSKGYVRKR
jgi:hypothetical protein